MKKNIFKFCSLLLIISLCLSSIGNTKTQAAGKKVSSITIFVKNSKKGIQSVGKKIHKNLMKGKSITVKVKQSTMKKEIALLNKVSIVVGKQNKQSIGFNAQLKTQKNGYRYYQITDAKTYQYMTKFVKKMYKVTQNILKKQETYTKFYEYYKKYNNLKTLKMHILYDVLSYKSYTDYMRLEGYQKPVTNVLIYLKSTKLSKLTSAQKKDLLIKKEGIYEDSYNMKIKYAQLNTFKEFKEKLSKYPKALDVVALDSSLHVPGTNTYFPREVLSPEEMYPAIVIMKTKNFCDLSKATQLYAIDMSQYFGCNFKGTSHTKLLAAIQGLKKAYGMYYNYSYKGLGSEANYAKALYQGKAEGVCMTFAYCEHLLFRLLGYQSYYCSRSEIDHAYTVVKIKNSKGKTLWVPFDYGIGPSESLSVSQEIRKKYLKTEKMRYKLYLKGLKGAPKKKNFTLADFI